MVFSTESVETRRPKQLLVLVEDEESVFVGGE
jgi:hypothetical protein